MTTATTRKKLAETKQALAAKYTSLARIARSKPRRAHHLRQATKYRRQAEQLLQQ